MGKKSTAEEAGQIKEQEGFLEVSRTLPGKPVETKREKLKIRPFVTNPATVSVKMGATIPTVDYANARFDVMMSVPCYTEEMVDVFHDLKKTVEELADQFANEISSGMKAQPATPVGGEKSSGADLDDLL